MANITNKKNFVPFELAIETEAEAIALLHALNGNKSISVGDGATFHISDNKMEEILEKEGTKLWHLVHDELKRTGVLEKDA